MADTKLFEVDTEVAVLSLILKNPHLIKNANGLRFHMFSSNPHQALYGEFEELVEKQLLPDPTLVHASLESKNALDSVGGKKYLELLVSKDVNESSFDELVKLVVNSYKARSLLSISAGVTRSKLNSSNINEEIQQMRRSLDQLLDANGHASTVHVSEIATDAYREILERTKNPGTTGHSWGNNEIDKITGGKSGGDLWVVAGRPGMGKTAIALNSVYADAMAGIPSLMIAREMRNQQLLERLICIDTGIPNTNIRLGVLNNDQISQVYDSLSKLKKCPIYIDNSYQSSDLSYVESTVNKYRNEHGVEVVYLDYLQLLTERDETQTQEIGRLTRLFKILSNQLNICSVLLSQLNRNVESREDKRPLLSDMRQSGAIEEDADFVVGLYRDEVYNKESKYKGLLEYIILKHRNGPPGTITARFDGPTNRVSEAR